MHIHIFSHKNEIQLMFPDNNAKMTSEIAKKLSDILKNKAENSTSQKVLTKLDMNTGLHYDLVY